MHRQSSTEFAGGNEKKKNTKNFVQTGGRLNLSPSISPLNTFKASISIMASTEAAQLPPAGKWEQGY